MFGLKKKDRRHQPVAATGKFSIQLLLESILCSSFTVVSRKWELLFHGHKPSNSFTVRKISELSRTSEMPAVPLSYVFVPLCTRTQHFQVTAVWLWGIIFAFPLNRAFKIN